MKKKLLKITLALALTAVLLYWCFHQIQWELFVDSFRQAHLSWIAFAWLASFSIIALNSIQLKFFLPRFEAVSFRRMFPLVAIFSMTVNVVPFWGGHALMIYLLDKREKLSKTVGLSVMTLDQIIEGFAKLFVFGVVVLSGPFPDWMTRGMQAFMALVSVTYLVFFFLSYYYGRRASDALPKHFPWRERLKALFLKWAYHLHVLRNGKSLLITIALAILMKGMEVLSVYAIQKSFSLSLGWESAFLVVAALSLATTLPLTPGRLGLFEGAAMLTYQYLGLSATEGLALGVMIHVAHTVPLVITGYLASVKLGLKSWRSPVAEPPYEIAEPAFAKSG